MAQVLILMKLTVLLQMWNKAMWRVCKLKMILLLLPQKALIILVENIKCPKDLLNAATVTTWGTEHGGVQLQKTQQVS